MIENDAGGPSKGQSDGGGGAQEVSSEEVTFEQRPGVMRDGDLTRSGGRVSRWRGQDMPRP